MRRPKASEDVVSQQGVVGNVARLAAILLVASLLIGSPTVGSRASTDNASAGSSLMPFRGLASAIRLPADPADGLRLDPAELDLRTDYFAAVVTDAVPVVRDGVRYWFNLEIWQPGADATPLVDAFLFKGYGHGASQFFDYEFQTDRPYGFDRKRLASQSFDGGRRELGPSRVSETFAPTEPLTSHTCETFDGSTGTHKERRGVLSYGQLSIHTGTSPFFGTITERPVDATLIFDPFCVPSGKHGDHRCPATVSLGAVGNDPNGGPILYADGPGPAKKGTVEGILDAATIWHAGWPENIFFIGGAPVPDADLPTPSWNQDGASGSLSTDGFAFGSGAGTFSSNREPEVRRGLTCRAHGLKHTYTSYHYKGRFLSDPRFIDRFVTGDHQLPLQPRGDLYVAEYTS